MPHCANKTERFWEAKKSNRTGMSKSEGERETETRWGGDGRIGVRRMRTTEWGSVRGSVSEFVSGCVRERVGRRGEVGKR